MTDIYILIVLSIDNEHFSLSRSIFFRKRERELFDVLLSTNRPDYWTYVFNHWFSLFVFSSMIQYWEILFSFQDKWNEFLVYSIVWTLENERKREREMFCDNEHYNNKKHLDRRENGHFSFWSRSWTISSPNIFVSHSIQSIDRRRVVCFINQ